MQRIWPALLTFAGAGLYALWSTIVVTVWPHSLVASSEPARRHLEGYIRWDSGWYLRIVTEGYHYYGPGRQSAVAFFPGYPFAIRAAETVLRDTYAAGIFITVVAAAAAVQLLHRWVSMQFDSRTAAATVVLLVAWPYAYYLFGVVYSDALFLVFVIAAFVLLERGHPWLATLAASAATATRLVGVAVTVGLLVRALERDGVLRSRWSSLGAGRIGSAPTPRFLRLEFGRLRAATLAPIASIAGLGGYCILLWYRFGQPFAFLAVGSAPGWDRRVDPRTIAKYGYFHIVARHPVSVITYTLTVSAVLTALALALIPLVARRLGLGYALYSLIVIALPLVSSPEFIGMGRYLIAAFPCLAVGAQLLGRTPDWTRRTAVAGSSVLLAVLSTFFIRGYYLA